jgi:hypothetical protein
MRQMIGGARDDLAFRIEPQIFAVVGWAKAHLRRAHHLSTAFIANGGHAEFIIERAFARPGGFAHPTILSAIRVHLQVHQCPQANARHDAWGPIRSAATVRGS